MATTIEASQQAFWQCSLEIFMQQSFGISFHALIQFHINYQVREKCIKYTIRYDAQTMQKLLAWWQKEECRETLKVFLLLNHIEVCVGFEIITTHIHMQLFNCARHSKVSWTYQTQYL